MATQEMQTRGITKSHWICCENDFKFEQFNMFHNKPTKGGNYG